METFPKVTQAKTGPLVPSRSQRRALRTLAAGGVTGVRVARRARAVLLLAEGHSIRGAARRVRLAPRIVHYWGHVFRQQGPDGLLGVRRQHHPPQPSKAEQVMKPVVAFLRDPRDWCRAQRVTLPMRALEWWHGRILHSLYLRATGNGTPMIVTRVQIDGLTDANWRRALKIVGTWLRRNQMILVDEQVLSEQTTGRDWGKATVRANSRTGEMTLSWTGFGQVDNLQKALREAQLHVRVRRTGEWSYGMPSLPEPKSWRTLLDRFPRPTRPVVQPLLDALDRSKGWRIALCDSCRRHGRLNFVFAVGRVNVKDCLQCRRFLSPTQRWRGRQIIPSRVTGNLPIARDGDMCSDLSAEDVPIIGEPVSRQALSTGAQGRRGR